MKEKARFLLTAYYELVVIGLSAGLGLVAAVGTALFAPDRIRPELYATLAQIFPVFLIALAVEQRLMNRLGMTEDEYAARAGRSADMAVQATIAYEDLDETRGKKIELLLDAEPEFQWVGRYAMDLTHATGPEDAPDIQGMARRRYRARRRNEAAFVASSTCLLAVGQGAALAGLLQGGTSRCSPLLWFSMGTVVAAFLAITLGGAREWARNLRV